MKWLPYILVPFSMAPLGDDVWNTGGRKLGIYVLQCARIHFFFGEAWLH